MIVVILKSLSHVQLFVTPWTAACQVSLSLTISWSLPKFMSIVSVIPSSHHILCCLLLFCLQSFPASGSFPMSCLFSSGGQSIGASASASVLPMNVKSITKSSIMNLLNIFEHTSHEYIQWSQLLYPKIVLLLLLNCFTCVRLCVTS